ncbi:hypothetical protein [Bifidobacterium breve]|uniref:hypothetical protein n=1 Tax=Bifidobacterium breve TaxID=1685 RepID=UPI0039FD8F57
MAPVIHRTSLPGWRQRARRLGLQRPRPIRVSTPRDWPPPSFGRAGAGGHPRPHARRSRGRRHVYALKDDGTAWSWGDNYGGVLGDSRDAPVLIGGTEVVQ